MASDTPAEPFLTLQSQLEDYKHSAILFLWLKHCEFYALKCYMDKQIF